MEEGANVVLEVANVDMAEIGLGVLDFMADLKLFLRFSCRHSLDPPGSIIMKEGVSRVKFKNMAYIPRKEKRLAS